MSKQLGARYQGFGWHVLNHILAQAGIRSLHCLFAAMHLALGALNYLGGMTRARAYFGPLGEGIIKPQVFFYHCCWTILAAGRVTVLFRNRQPVQLSFPLGDG